MNCQNSTLIEITLLEIKDDLFWETWDNLASSLIPSGFEFAEAFDCYPMPEDAAIDKEEIKEWVKDLERVVCRYTHYERTIAQIYWCDYLIRRFLNKELRP